MRNSLLPASASQLENDLLTLFERWVSERLLIDREIPVRLLWNPEHCPVVMLPYLACAFSVDNAVFQFTRKQVANAIRNSVSLHKKKGTVHSVSQVVEDLGYTVSDVVEGVDNSWWKYSIVLGSRMSRASKQAIETLIVDVAPARCELHQFTFDETHDYSGYIDSSGKVPGTDDYDFTYNSEAPNDVYTYGVL